MLHINQVKNPTKRVNIISNKDILDSNGKVIHQAGILMRTTRSLAAKYIATGNYSYTSKSKMKSFLNREAKLHRNKRTIKTFGTSSATTYFEQMATIPHKGKKYSLVTCVKFLMRWTTKHWKHRANRAEVKKRLTEEKNLIGVASERGSMRVITSFPN